MANNLRNLRYDNGYKSPEKAAQKLDISVSMLYKIETGEKKPGRDLIYKMSQIYNCTTDEIFLAFMDTNSVRSIS